MELLDIGEEIGRDFAPKPSNVPELMLLPVDPEHIYAYWSLEQDKQAEIPDDEQLTLRIYPQADRQYPDTETTPTWFDVAIDNGNIQQQVALPPPLDNTAYSAAIGKYCADHGFIELAHSKIIHTPRGRTARPQPQQNSTYRIRNNASGLGIDNVA